MLFGKSLFQSVVDRLEAERQDEIPPEATTPRRVGITRAFVAETHSINFGAVDHRQDAYLFLMPEVEPVEEKPPPPPVIPDWIDRLDVASITEDLGILDADDRETLLDRRRSFAKDNHPDKIDPIYREQATTRMKTANLLIDEALRRLNR